MKYKRCLNTETKFKRMMKNLSLVKNSIFVHERMYAVVHLEID